MTNLSILRQIAKYLRQLNEVIHVQCGQIAWRSICITVKDGYVIHHFKYPFITYQFEFLSVKSWYGKIVSFMSRFGAVYKSLNNDIYVQKPTG